MKILPKNDLGVQQLLTIINQMKDKNEVFIRNSFRWLIDKHPPFPGSKIIFNPPGNEFKFWKPKAGEFDYRIKLWKDFQPDDYIKEDVFMYYSVEPYPVLIANADWINRVRAENDIKKQEAIDTFYVWYHNQVSVEREALKKLLKNNRDSGGSVPLF